MKHKLFLLGALFLLLTVASCRQESDALYSYGQNDELRFQEANESYAGEFKLFWHAMNRTIRSGTMSVNSASTGMPPTMRSCRALRPSISGSKMARRLRMRNIRVCWMTLCALFMIAT